MNTTIFNIARASNHNFGTHQMKRSKTHNAIVLPQATGVIEVTNFPPKFLGCDKMEAYYVNFDCTKQKVY